MITVDWGNFEETFLVFKIRGRWSTSEFVEASHNWEMLIRSKHYPVDTIVDMQRAARAPANIISVSFRIVKKRPENMGRTVILSPQSLWQRIWQSTRGIYGSPPLDIHFVRDLDTAYALVNIGDDD